MAGSLTGMELAWGRIEQALTAACNSVQLADLSRDPQQMSKRRAGYAWILHQRGDASSARRAFDEALSVAGEESRVPTGMVAHWYGEFLLTGSAAEEVVSVAESAMADARSRGWRLAYGLNTLTLARALMKGGDVDRARSMVSDGIDRVRQASQQQEVCRGLLTGIEIELARGDRGDEATALITRWLREAVAIATMVEEPMTQAEVCLVEGQVARTNHDDARADYAFRKVEQLVGTGYGLLRGKALQMANGLTL
jgi:hypothetical protein